MCMDWKGRGVSGGSGNDLSQVERPDEVPESNSFPGFFGKRKQERKGENGTSISDVYPPCEREYAGRTSRPPPTRHGRCTTMLTPRSWLLPGLAPLLRPACASPADRTTGPA